MASSYSSQLRLELQATGENENTWGTIANTQFNLLEDAIAGFVSISMTSGGDVTPSQSNGVVDEARNAVLILTGTPTSNVGLNIPNVGKNYIIRNKITNSASVRVQVEGDVGNELKIPSDYIGLIHSDGTNIYEVARQMNVAELVSAALRDDVTSIRSELATVSKAIAGSVARLDSDNDFENNRLTNYTVCITSVGAEDITLTSAHSGQTLVFDPQTSANIAVKLAKNLPLGWNATLISLVVSGAVEVSSPVSTSMVNTSGHTGLNNYGSGAALLVCKQEGANSHAWFFFQGETE